MTCHGQHPQFRLQKASERRHKRQLCLGSLPSLQTWRLRWSLWVQQVMKEHNKHLVVEQRNWTEDCTNELRQNAAEVLRPRFGPEMTRSISPGKRLKRPIEVQVEGVPLRDAGRTDTR